MDAQEIGVEVSKAVMLRKWSTNFGEVHTVDLLCMNIAIQNKVYLELQKTNELLAKLVTGQSQPPVVDPAKH